MNRRSDASSSLARDLTPPLLQDAYRSLRLRWHRWRFAATGRRPWSPGYGDHKVRLVDRIIHDGALLANIGRGGALPDGFGVGVDERCIELPWCLSHLPSTPATVLDAGSALNHRFLLDNESLRNKTLHIVTLAPEGEAFWREGISYLFGDLRALPYRDAYFEVVACISTLEHIGCDASIFTHDPRHQESQPDSFLLAARELIRVLRPGGSLLLSVPYGKRMSLGHSRQFDRELLAELLAVFDAAGCTQSWFFRYSQDGWQASDEASCRSAIYELAPQTAGDHAAAARSVVCIRVDKALSSDPTV